MTRDISPDLQQIRLFFTQPHGCSYLPGKEATTAFVDPSLDINASLYTQLTQMGFRRSGRYYYQPRCQLCAACISARIPVAEFSPNRQQRRCLQRNRDLSIAIKPNINVDEHYALYENYINSRHEDGDMFPPTREQYLDFLGSGIEATRFVEFRLDGILLGCSVLDRLDDGVSAIYTYYSPEIARRSLGTLAVLTLVDLAREMELPYVYLGFWIKNCTKMAYKSRFQPLELLIGGRWIRNSSAS
ncbi:MAG: arginyl-tRNA-protein transferase [Gammaproteobacteria bacterium BRH_c0]|nr:MAG: arginyl-tRNA-protein transferase [Gammaproteobacteria bacterium BRH_c0]